jgi:hypothetical protein
MKPTLLVITLLGAIALPSPARAGVGIFQRIRQKQAARAHVLSSLGTPKELVSDKVAVQHMGDEGQAARFLVSVNRQGHTVSTGQMHEVLVSPHGTILKSRLLLDVTSP